MTQNICPKCKKNFIHKNHFNTPDGEGGVGVVWHGEKVKHGPYGSNKFWSNGCFLTQEEWDSIENPIWITSFNPKKTTTEMILEQGFHTKGSLFLPPKKRVDS